RGPQGLLEQQTQRLPLVERVEPRLGGATRARDAPRQFAGIVRRGGGQRGGALDRREREALRLLLRQPKIARGGAERIDAAANDGRAGAGERRHQIELILGYPLRGSERPQEANSRILPRFVEPLRGERQWRLAKRGRKIRHHPQHAPSAWEMVRQNGELDPG